MKLGLEVVFVCLWSCCGEGGHQVGRADMSAKSTFHRHVGAPTCRRPRRHLQTNFAPDQGAVVAADTWRIRRRRADTARPTLVDTGAASTGTSGLDGQGGAEFIQFIASGVPEENFWGPGFPPNLRRRRRRRRPARACSRREGPWTRRSSRRSLRSGKKTSIRRLTSPRTTTWHRRVVPAAPPARVGEVYVKINKIETLTNWSDTTTTATINQYGGKSS